MLLCIVKEKIELEHSRVSFTPKYLSRGVACSCVTTHVLRKRGLRSAMSAMNRMTVNAPEEARIRFDEGSGVFSKQTCSIGRGLRIGLRQI